ncbi:hypothetical protein Q0Z83_082790 [Actinoplanes sichuanensis]|uniref:Camelysin metallo-endopeptidase n=1 Tax=Actinoplanes sichuanensis TaxID=512349 RepID=A0ABW4ADG2_9ACTN|nr:hypothetical protein [Actinoplanes sichuanensis]BEL10088.1 hypothetical protein Q0Z83_082790 [Actinoplanes sichuanensis]
MRKSIKRAVVIGTALAVTTGATAAYAAWVARGTGEAKAQAVTAAPLTTGSVTLAADLYPGATGDAKITINNPNSYKVKVADIIGSTVTASGGIGDCAGTNVVFANQTGKDIEVPAKGNVQVTLTNAVSMIADAENGCQGATFTVAVSLVGASAA